MMSDRAGDLKMVVFLILTKRREDGKAEILLQRRQNTGYMDEKYDFSASGHLKNGESVDEAICREAREELGIMVRNVECAMFLQGVREGYFKCVFQTEEWEGTPEIMEPDKCSELRWFRKDELPEEEMIWYLPKVLSDIEEGRVLRVYK